MHAAKMMDSEESATLNGAVMKFAAARAEMKARLDELESSPPFITIRERIGEAAQACVELNAQKSDIERLAVQARNIISQAFVEDDIDSYQDAHTKVIVTSPSSRAHYDADQLDALVIELTQTNPEIAARIASLREVRTTAGSLRVTRKV